MVFILARKISSAFPAGRFVFVYRNCAFGQLNGTSLVLSNARCKHQLRPGIESHNTTRELHDYTSPKSKHWDTFQRKEIEGLAEQIDHLRKRVCSIENSYMEWQSQIIDLREQNDEKSREVKEIFEFSSQLSQLRKKYENLTNSFEENSELHERVDDLYRQIYELNEQMRTLSEEKIKKDGESFLKAEEEQLGQEKVELRYLLENLEEKVNDLTNHVKIVFKKEDSDSLADKMKEELGELKIDLEGKIDSLKVDIEEHIENLKEQLEEIEDSSNREDNEQIERIEEKHDNLKENLEEQISDTNDELGYRIDNLDKRIDDFAEEFNKRHDYLEERIKDVMQRTDDVKQEVEPRFARILAQVDDLTKNSSNKSSNLKLDHLEEQIVALNNRFEHLKDTLFDNSSEMGVQLEGINLKMMEQRLANFLAKEVKKVIGEASTSKTWEVKELVEKVTQLAENTNSLKERTEGEFRKLQRNSFLLTSTTIIVYGTLLWAIFY